MYGCLQFIQMKEPKVECKYEYKKEASIYSTLNIKNVLNELY